MNNPTTSLGADAGGLPVWAWIVIAVVAVVVIVAAVVLIKIARAKKAEERQLDGEPDLGEGGSRSAPDDGEDAAPEGEEEAAAPAGPDGKEDEPAAAARGDAERPAETARSSGPKVYHITKRMSDGKWQIKFNKGKKAIKLFDTQMQAIDYAKALAQSQEASIMIHKEDGTFRKLRYDKPGK